MSYLALVTGAAAIAATHLWTANDPFVGKWKLDVPEAWSSIK
jgi:hypothetical protein